ncbi:U3 small nucleolar RNA-associated protein 13 [Arachnomyces sp. PD_36]|nr:U3 small nucleolar RNA-associated protein 13 [Arachnomyces sp. PD_36]
MSFRPTVKTTFEATRTIQPIYTGGSVSLDESGTLIATCVGEDVLIIDIESREQLARIEGDGELSTSLAITPNASHLVVCSRSLSMRIYSLNRTDELRLSIQPQLLRTLKPHTSPVVTTAVDSTGTLFATGCADGTIKVWDIRGGYVTHTFHGHGGVISALCFFELPIESQGNEVSEKKKKKKRKNGEDHEMDDDNQASMSGYRLASGSEDGKVRIWDLLKRKSIASLESHVSVVRSLSYSTTENAVLSASRDKTVIVWDARTWKLRRIIPVLESVEAAGFISNGSLCYTGGENGQLAVWDINRGGRVTNDQEPRAENEAIISIERSADSSFVMSVHADQTIRFHSLDPVSEYKPGSKIDPLPIIRRISGNDDEIIDLGYVGPDGSLLALATNSESIRIVSILSPAEGHAEESLTSDESRHFGTDVAHLDGHEDIIICLDIDWSGHWLATGAKDNTARLWRIDPETSSYTCCAVFTGHAESLGAISFPRAPPPSSSSSYTDPLNHPPAFLVTGSQDRTIKRWDTSKLKPLTDSPQTPKAIFTRKAHEKDINALDVNYSSSLFASASQDRTVKIWSIEDGSVLGILRGHRRGVWSARFAPEGTPKINSETGASNTRGLILTGSGDKTLKIWSLSDYSCILTFEGHTNSVLKVLWLPPPRISNADEDAPARTESAHPLVASAGGDGLVKIWSPYTGELETTLDNHTDRVWALATPFSPSSLSRSKQTSQKTEYSLVSGSADSTITFWTDTTSSTFSAAVNANTERIEQDQQLQNYINAGAYREAITLALQLNHPRRLLHLFTAAIDSSKQDGNIRASQEGKETGLTGNPDIDTVLQSLGNENLYTLLLHIRDWNTNARTSLVAQRLLYALAKSYPPSTFVQLASQRRVDLEGRKGRKTSAGGMKEVFDALAAYTDRHYRRVEELADESFLVEWVLSEMDGGVSGLSLGEQIGGVVKDMIMLDA